MKYTVQIVCAVLGALPAIPVEAETDKGAVDIGRALHVVPDEGGDYSVSVTCDEPASVMVPNPDPLAVAAGHPEWIPGTRPAGAVISEFKVTHEPKAHVADAVRADRKAAAEIAAKAAERAKIKEEVLAEIAAEQAAAGKAVQS